MLKKFCFTYCKPVKYLLSLPVKIHTDVNGIEENASMYPVMIGSLLYIILSHRNIMFATSMRSCYQENPKESLLKQSSESLDT